MRKELLIGCGSQRDKRLALKAGQGWDGLITLDNNRDHNPDWVWDLRNLPLPFADDSLDEIHAYDVLEHTGTQGDYRFFFAQFSDFWRMLKPDGILFAIVPSPDSIWAWGDPSHTRILHPQNVGFLDQTAYDQVGKSPISDFRYLYKADFKAIHLVSEQGGSTQFALQAVKPSRIKE